MRVIAGFAKGRKLLSVPGHTTRPILDRIKTSLFDILRPQLAGARMLDLFAGSGSVGIEALSQGAAWCTFVDVEKRATETIRANLSCTKLTAQAEVRLTDAFVFLRKTSKEYDIIYVAPPQYQGLWVQALHALAERPEIAAPRGMVIAQLDPREYEELSLREFAEMDRRKYGNTMIVFYRRE